MRNLNIDLKRLYQRNRDDSYATQRDRERVLDLVARQRHDLTCRHSTAAGAMSKPLKGPVQRWIAEGLAVGTTKNQTAAEQW